MLAEVEQLERRLQSDIELEELLARQDDIRSRQQQLELRLRDTEREVEGHRVRLRGRQRELMSGRVRNPTELMQMSTEVDNMRERLRSEEDAELDLMEQVEAVDAERNRLQAAVEEARVRVAAAAPGLRERLEAVRTELAEVESERDADWSQVPPAYQQEYRRIRAQPAVAEVVGNACAACRVSVTSGQMQRLRRGELIHCDNCARILVVA